MTPLQVQGLFHLYFDLMFFILGIKLWSHYKNSQNLLAKYLSLSFIFAGFEYIFLAIPPLFLSDDLISVKWMGGVFAMVLFYIAIAYAWFMLPILFPKFPFKPAMAFFGLLAAVMVSLSIYPFAPALINKAGVIDYGFPPIVILTASLLLMGTFVPVTVAFIIKTLKSKMYVQGLTLGFGLLFVILFMPITYQVTTFGSYVFFSSLAAAGFTLCALGVVIHPLLRGKKDAAATL